MIYFLGIDGGGTKTEALVGTADGAIVGRGIAGPSNPIFIEKASAFDNIGKSIKLALKGHSRETYFSSAAICIPGIKRYRDELEAQLLKDCTKVYIDGDELNAFCGALAKPYGVIVLAGTGSFAMGINKKGEKAEMGGWGPIIGDEGSGYYIGVSGLRAVVKEFEGTGVKTSLTPRIMEALKLKNIEDLRRNIHSDGPGRNVIGGLSKLVQESASEGDEASVEIVNTAAMHLADLAIRVIKRLHMYDGEYDAALTGGVSNFGDMILDPFTERLRKERAGIHVVKPRFVPAVGALMIAMRESGIDVYDKSVLNHLSVTYKSLSS